MKIWKTRTVGDDWMPRTSYGHFTSFFLYFYLNWWRLWMNCARWTHSSWTASDLKKNPMHYRKKTDWGTTNEKKFHIIQMIELRAKININNSWQYPVHSIEIDDRVFTVSPCNTFMLRPHTLCSIPLHSKI